MIQKIKRDQYSNSGKSITTRILIKDETYSYYFPNEIVTKASPPYWKKKEIIDTPLELTEQDVQLFLIEKEKKENYERRYKDAQEEKERKAKIDLENFLNKEFVNGIYYRDFYDKLKYKFEHGPDYNMFSYIEIALICFDITGLLDIVWVGDYNKYPKLKHGILAKNPDMDLFYIIEDNEIKYSITCKDEKTGKHMYETDFYCFDFEVVKHKKNA